MRPAGCSSTPPKRAAPAPTCPERANHVRITNVLFLDIGSPEWGSGAKLFRIFGGVSDVSITHVTSTGNARGILDPRDAQDANPNLMFQNNLIERYLYGTAPGARRSAYPVEKFSACEYRQNVPVKTSEGMDQAISDAALRGK